MLEKIPSSNIVDALLLKTENFCLYFLGNPPKHTKLYEARFKPSQIEIIFLSFSKVTTKELDRDLAEFFRLFSRCASLVPAAEANTCINELSKSLLTLVTHEKCKVKIRLLYALVPRISMHNFCESCLYSKSV